MVSAEVANRLPGLEVTDRFDPAAMQEFMRRDDVYWPSVDALSPSPEHMDFIPHILHQDTWIAAATYGGHIIGYVKFVRQTGVGAELHAAFHPKFRGRVAKAVTMHAIGLAFRDKGLLKLWALVPADNRPAAYGCRAIGFRLEGRLTNAIVRKVSAGPPLRDILIFGLSKG